MSNQKMDYITASLQNIYGISIHWSSDCNMACKYCYIEKDKPHMEAYNAKIRQALGDGSFVENIKRRFTDETIRNQIQDLSLWGAEPTVNGQYFASFVPAILDYFPNMESFMFSTNALMGGKWIYEKFFLPLYEYCETHQRKLKWNLQLSLDGPPEFNDASRHVGATRNTIEAAKILLDNAPEHSEFLSIHITTKPTLDVSYMKIMNERGLDSFNWYFQFFNKVQDEVMQHLKQDYVQLQMNGVPTVVDPGCHTVEDGKIFAEWVNNLKYVDMNKLNYYHGQPLFYQLISGIDLVINNTIIRDNPLGSEWNAFSCSASKNNITVDYNGDLYTCNRLCRNAAMPEEERTKHAMRSGSTLNQSERRWLMNTWGSAGFHGDLKSRRYLFDAMVIVMAKVGQIQEKYMYDAYARTLLFYSTMGMMCHIGNEEDYTQIPSIIPTSILKLIGNGALDNLLDYYIILQQRGEINQWKIATLT